MKKKFYGRERVCIDCGDIKTIRKDSPAIRCASCNGRISGAEGNKNRKITSFIKECKNCKKPHKVYLSEKDKIFCSSNCHYEYSRVDKICQECGNSFKTQKRSTNKGLYCGFDCKIKALTIGGINTRPGFSKAKREHFSGINFCSLCGTTKKIHIHHITPYRITRNNDKNNLIPLCCPCHARVEIITKDAFKLGFDVEKTALFLRLQLREMQMTTYKKIKELVNAKNNRKKNIGAKD